MCTVVCGGGNAGPVSPRSDRRGHSHCAACAVCPSLDSGTHGGPCRRAGSPSLGRRYATGRKRWGLRRDRYRLGVIAEPTVTVTGAREPAAHSSFTSGLSRPGRASVRSRSTLAGHSPRHWPAVRASSRFSHATGGVLTGPRPAPAAELGRTGLPADSDHASAGAAGRAPRTGGAGRRQPALGVKVSDRD
jgi:hypothetical protein